MDRRRLFVLAIALPTRINPLIGAAAAVCLPTLHGDSSYEYYQCTYTKQLAREQEAFAFYVLVVFFMLCAVLKSRGEIL